jgi:hypothetical protein
MQRAALVSIALVALLGGCAVLPPLEGRVASTAITDTASTRLARAMASDIGAHPAKSGIHALVKPEDAFAARVLLAAAAERSLDLQYYIWNGDQTGYLLYEAAWRALSAAFACASCSTTRTRVVWTTSSRPWMRIRTSTCACTTR